MVEVVNARWAGRIGCAETFAQEMTSGKLNVATPFVCLGASVFGGAILGALTNAINGRVSPLYYRNIMRWKDVEDIPSAATAQGIFEGIIMGFVLGLVLVVAVSIISKLRAKVSDGLFLLGKVFCSALAAWIVGGLLAIALASISPEFYQNAFIRVPESKSLMIPYAWVGGCIWGIQFGGFALLIVWLVVFGVQWKSKIKRSEQGEDTNPPPLRS